MKSTKTKKRKKRKRLGSVRLICWLVIPAAMTVMLLLDGFGLYPLSTERMMMLGGCALVMLIPFFDEINVRDVSLKK